MNFKEWLILIESLDTNLEINLKDVINSPKNPPDKKENTFSDFDTLYGNEIDIVTKVQNSSLIGQAEIDMQLHDDVMDTDRFDDKSKNFLKDDKQLKKDFIQAILGNIKTPEKIEKIINGLKYDKSIHQRYLLIPADINTGSHGWHNHWISVYDNWINNLTQIMKKL